MVVYGALISNEFLQNTYDHNFITPVSQTNNEHIQPLSPMQAIGQERVESATYTTANENASQGLAQGPAGMCVPIISFSLSFGCFMRLVMRLNLSDE